MRIYVGIQYINKAGEPVESGTCFASDYPENAHSFEFLKEWLAAIAANPDANKTEESYLHFTVCTDPEHQN